MNSGRFRLVYSQNLAMFVPVPETAAARGRKSASPRRRSRHALVAAVFSLAAAQDVMAAPPVGALPTAGVISSGAGSISSAGNAMTVNQSTQKMIVNWGSFNIGSAASVKFAQPNVNSAVLNRVSGAGGSSQIYGNLTANGQVYLINPNGILFGNGARVNVNSLVASSLDITDTLFDQGILSASQGAVFSGSGGFVEIETGANLTSANGGKIMLFAPVVTNKGLIETPDGQALLAAGNSIYLAASADPGMRGLLVEVNGSGSAKTTVENIGQIIAKRGNVTLAGMAVNQSGRVTATSTVTANGSIKLQARQVKNPATDFESAINKRIYLPTEGGELVLGANSITEVLPETSDKATVQDRAKLQDSFVDISAQTIHLMDNAWIVAPGGNVNLYAGLNLPELNLDSQRTLDINNKSPDINEKLSKATANASRIYFESGSGIDVSGIGSGSQVASRAGETAAQKSVADNIVQAELRSNELRDSPLQRNGILFKSKVFVDSRTKGINGDVGTSVADVSGYTAQIGHTVSERLAKGGSVKVQSEGDIVFNQGASINVSGGKVDYTGGKVTSTLLVASNGKVYDIANAPKDLTYTAIKNVSHMEQGYSKGSDAGNVLFNAPAMVLQGNLKGNAINGLHQRTATTRPQGATLQIGQSMKDQQGVVNTNVLHSNLIFGDLSTGLSVPAFLDPLTADQKQSLHLSSDFFAPKGFSNLKFFTDGQITVANGSDMQVMSGGSISLNGAGIDVKANLTAHGGAISLLSKRTRSSGSKGSNNVEVANGSTLNVSGIWTNDTLNPTATDAIVLTGGIINLETLGQEGVAGGDVILNSASQLNASGGAWLDSARKLTSGNAGSITLAAGGGSVDNSVHSSKLVLNGMLRADSLATGGNLNLTSGSITIGSSALESNGELLLAPSFFRNGGFNAYNITSYENLTVADNVTLAPVAQTRILDRNFANQVTGTDITGFSHLELLPSTGLAPIRKPVSVSLKASTETTGNLHLGAGSSIAVDPGASVTLYGRRQLTALGAITTPAGKISMTVGTTPNPDDVVHYLNNQTLWLGANSILDVSGVADVYTNSIGLRVGGVKDAGSITLNAEKGAVVAEKGAVLNLNGTLAVLDLKSGNGYVAREVASSGGDLTISAREGVLFDAAIDAHAGNNSVQSGKFSLSLPVFEPGVNIGLLPASQYPSGPREIILKVSGHAVPAGLQVGDAINSVLNGKAFVYADQLQNAGFDSASFAKSDNIRFVESLKLSMPGAITLDTPKLLVNDGVSAVLNSSYVGMGNSQAIYQDNSHVGTPIAGTGSLAVNAQYIELFGKQNLSGIKNAVFNSSGDIQLKGVLPGNQTAMTPTGGLNTAGDLTLKAARVFPATLSEYTLSSTGSDATISFEKNGNDSGVPFSVLGTLNVQAANIKQGGVLRAPLGVIDLDAGYLDADNVKHPGVLTLMDGSLTSVSAEGKTLPFGNTTNGKDWSFDFGDRIRSFSVLPDKAINLDGQSVNVLAGSKIDVSGGGDLQAWEFTTGTGGSDDVLAATGVFAILPGLSSAYMPGNSQSYTNGGLEPGDMIYLSGGNGLAAGYFTLLPAHYALMPGGYSVKVVAGTQDRVAQQNTTNADGSMLISGYRLQSGGLTADSRSSGFLVTSGSILRTQSEFSDTFASNLFKSIYKDKQLTGYRLPDDAGRLAISAANNLVLDGAIAASHASTARGAEVDISSSNIAISADGSKVADYLTLDSAKLNAIGAESLLIGGTRSGVAEGTQVDVTASNIKLIGNASLSGSEILLAAKDTVSLASGTSVHGSGLVSANSGDLIVGNANNAGSGDGALLRVSSGKQRDLIRKGTSPVSEQVKGTLEIQSGATLAATGSIIADATYSNNLQGAVALSDGGALRLGAPKISFGNPVSAVTGVLFDNSKLAALGNPGDLQLKSYSTFDFYGNVALGNSGLSSLTLESAGLAGFDNAGKSVTLTANKVKFTNLDGATFTPEGALGSAALGTGTLAVNAKEIETGAGVFHTAGFNTVALTADQVVGKDTGGLTVAGDLSIDAARITSASLADQTVSASGHLQTLKHEAAGLSKAALGGKLTLAADTISHGGVIDMPAGVVTLKAAGSKGGDSLILQSGSQINNQGSAQYLGTAAALVDGGRVNLQTGNGNIRMENGAVIDVSATGGAGAGTLSVLSAGTANLDGTLYGAALAGNHVVTPKQGSFDLKAASLPDFSALNTALEQGKFNQSRNIHVAQGDLTIGATETVTAHQFTLTTDDGDLTVAGKIDATGSKGGIVNLNAGQKAGDGKGNLTLASTAVIDASATTAAKESAGSTGDGGKVMLSTTTDGVTTPVTGSRINAASGSVINVSGKGLGSDGLVTLRAPRLGVADATSAGDGIAITNFGSTVTGVNATILAEGVKVYQNAGDLSLDSSFIFTLETDNASFMNNAGSIASSLGWASDSRFSVIAGDEVRSDGNISVDSDMNLQPWGNGALTLRAAGDINVNANISAGFSDAYPTGTLTADGGGWTYRMSAGADLSSADVMTTNDIGVGNFTLASDRLIRSGTGDINIATGGSFNLGSNTSVIYTAGTPDTKDYSGLGAFNIPSVSDDFGIFYTADFPINGGDISLAAKKDIHGAISTQLPTHWLYRTGFLLDDGFSYLSNPSWWSFFRDFRENIGALAGGDVNIATLGNINDLSAVIATNGRVFGTDSVNGKIIVNGGGDLTLHAGGDIIGGLYMVDKGTVNIRAGGGLLADSQGDSTAFALGDGQINVASLGQLNMLTVFNPTMTYQAINNYKDNSDYFSAFSTYNTNSSVTLTSVASDVNITNGTENYLQTRQDFLDSSSISVFMFSLYPASLNVAALGGDFKLSGPMAMMPAAQGDLQLLASGSINVSGSLTMSDIDPADLSSPLSPIQMNQNRFFYGSNQGFEGAAVHASIPVHEKDSSPVVIYAGKDISGVPMGSEPNLTLPKKAIVFAERDIKNLSITGQNLSNSDVSSITAGNDFYYPPYLFNGTLRSGRGSVVWGGPGYLNVTTGRNISLVEGGIVTRGNILNPFLPETGASISVLAGTSSADDNGFIAKYANPSLSSAYSKDLGEFVASVTGQDNLTIDEAWSEFQTLDASLKHQFVQSMFFNELKQAGVEYNSTSGTNSGSYQRGYTAIKTLYPDSNYNGDIDFSLAQIKTERGGDVNLMAPGGKIIVGIPKPPSGFEGTPSTRGLFSVKGGDINSFSHDNFEVAQSRVFTIAGGDILIWSTEGDIAAGAGAKTATSAPPPLVRTDDEGNTVIDLSGVVSGSGIGTLQTLPDVPPGDVYLIAPSGTVNAGDAGIRSSGNLLVASARVVGADNIQVGGVSSGVPQTQSSGINFSMGGLTDTTSASKSGDPSGNQQAASTAGNKSSFMPSFLTVEVIGMGDEAPSAGVKDDEEENKKNRKKSSPL